MLVYVKQRPKRLRRLDFDYILSDSGICTILHSELKGASMGHSFIKEAEGESVKENKNGMVKGKWIKSRGGVKKLKLSCSFHARVARTMIGSLNVLFQTFILFSVKP